MTPVHFTIQSITILFSMYASFIWSKSSLLDVFIKISTASLAAYWTFDMLVELGYVIQIH